MKRTIEWKHLREAEVHICWMETWRRERGSREREM